MARVLALVVALLLLALSCGSGDEVEGGSPAPTPEATSTEESASETTPSTTEATSTTSSTTTSTTETTTSTTDAPSVTPEPTPTPAVEPVAWTYFEDLDGVWPEVDVNPDGSTWAMTVLSNPAEAEAHGSGYLFSRLEGDSWVTYPGPQLVPDEDRLFVGFYGPIRPFLAAGPDGTAAVLDVRLAADGETPTADLWTFDGEAWIAQTDVAPLAGDRSWRIREIDVGGDGVVWVRLLGKSSFLVESAEGALLLRYDGAAWSEAEPLPEECLDCAIHVDLDGTVWSFVPSGLVALSDQEWSSHPRSPEYGEDSGWITNEDLNAVADDWTMWTIVARSGGEDLPYELAAQVHDGAAWSSWPDPERPEWESASAFAQQEFRALTAIGDQHLFVATGNGLVWFDVTGEVTGIKHEDGFPSGTVTGMLTDPDGAIWITTQTGITRFLPELYEAQS